jgi:hypothetical protein
MSTRTQWITDTCTSSGKLRFPDEESVRLKPRPQVVIRLELPTSRSAMPGFRSVSSPMTRATFSARRHAGREEYEGSRRPLAPLRSGS